MKKLRIAAILAAVMLLTALLTGCGPVNDAQYQLVFGKSAQELLPTVGNAAYSSRSLIEEEEEAAEAESEDTGDEAESESAEELDNYIDPTAGLDCSEE